MLIRSHDQLLCSNLVLIERCACLHGRATVHGYQSRLLAGSALRKMAAMKGHCILRSSYGQSDGSRGVGSKSQCALCAEAICEGS